MLRRIARLGLVLALVAVNAALFYPRELTAEDAHYEICVKRNNGQGGACVEQCTDWVFTHCSSKACVDECW